MKEGSEGARAKNDKLRLRQVDDRLRATVILLIVKKCSNFGLDSLFDGIEPKICQLATPAPG
jgi:hypothetical protein